MARLGIPPEEMAEIIRKAEGYHSPFLSRFDRNPQAVARIVDPNPIDGQPNDPRIVPLQEPPPVFSKTTSSLEYGVKGHCPDCSQYGDWSMSKCPHCNLTIDTIVERARHKFPQDEQPPGDDPDLSWPGDGTRWDSI